MTEMRSILARLGTRLGLVESGFVPTDLPCVRFFWSNTHVARAPLLYESGLIIIGQGRKTAYIDGRTFDYDADHYLVLSLPMAFECETFASPDEPLLGIFIDIDIGTLFELAGHVPAKPSCSETSTLGAEPVRLQADMRAAVIRLLEALCDPTDAAVLGQALVREVLYRALAGEHSSVLRAMIQPDSRHARIARVLRGVQSDLTRKRSVADMASEAGMSSPVFYRAFRAAMGTSPLQHIKKLRLMRARSLIVHDGMPANAAAFAVGYESPSQFSRDFRAYFGVTTVGARESAYAYVRS